MTITTVELNPGSGGAKSLHDSVTQVDGAAAPSGAVAQIAKMAYGDANRAQSVHEGAPLPTQEVSSPISLLNRILQVLMSPLGYDRSLARQRSTAVIESGTVTTVTTVAGLTNIDGRNGAMLINQTNLSAWADCVRARIT